MVVFGGYQGGSIGNYSNKIFALHLITLNWECWF